MMESHPVGMSSPVSMDLTRKAMKAIPVRVRIVAWTNGVGKCSIHQFPLGQPKVL